MTAHDNSSKNDLKNFSIKPEDDGASDPLAGEFSEVGDTIEVASSNAPSEQQIVQKDDDTSDRRLDAIAPLLLKER